MKVFVTQPIASEAVELLEENGYTVSVSTRKLTKEELLVEAAGCEALVSLVTDKIDADIIGAGKLLRVISNVAVGFNNIDVESARKACIIVANTPGVLEQSVAEMVFAHLLAISRKLVESDRYIRDGKFKEWKMDLFIGNELRGKTLGIVGFGRVGRALVPIAQALGMKIIYTDKNETYGVSLEVLLKESDYVVLAVPLNDGTKHLIKMNELLLMKKTAVLMNVARGPVVCEADLVKALKNGLISGACLDVHEFEPCISEELIKSTNTVLTPHLGSATKEARTRMALRAAQNVIDVLSGKICQNIVSNKNI